MTFQQPTQRARQKNEVTFSTLFPNTEQPNHGIFVETRLRYLLASGKAESRVQQAGGGHRPVVATNVWGTPEVVTAPEAGVLMKERSPQGLADALNELRANYPDHAATRRYAEGYSWDDTTQGQLDLFSRLVDGRGKGAAAAPALSSMVSK